MAGIGYGSRVRLKMGGVWPLLSSRLDNRREIYIDSWETGTIIGTQIALYMVVQFDSHPEPVVVPLFELESAEPGETTYLP